MAGDGVSSVSAVGIRWKTALVKDRTKAKESGEILHVQGGFEKRNARGNPCTFSRPRSQRAAGVQRRSWKRLQRCPPLPRQLIAGLPTPSRCRVQRIRVLPAKYKAAGKSFKGMITTMAERRVVIEIKRLCPSHSDRIEVKSVFRHLRVYCLKLYGWGESDKPANSQRSASFWVLITKVDECTPGLFRQYVDYIG